MLEKRQWRNDILSEHAGHRPAVYLECHPSTGVLKHFAGRNQLPGFYISRALVKNGLKSTFKLFDQRF